jgi:hypothetical protein
LSVDQKAWSHDLAMPGDEPQPWMMELAKMLILKDLPMGVIVGSAVIEACTPVGRGLSVVGGLEREWRFTTYNDQPATSGALRMASVRGRAGQEVAEAQGPSAAGLVYAVLIVMHQRGQKSRRLRL